VSAPDQVQEESQSPAEVTEQPAAPAEVPAAPAEVPAAPAELPAAATEAIRAAVHAEFDEVLPYVVEAMRRNNAFDEINDRLRAAERRIEARQERPVIVGMHRVLDRIRHLDFDQTIKQALADDVAKVLTEAGYEETGCIGEHYDPDRHDAIDGRAMDGKASVTKVHTHGLASFGDVVVRAKVEISPGPAVL
jgi:molecular chaperone GrpE (heat shock protein)